MRGLCESADLPMTKTGLAREMAAWLRHYLEHYRVGVQTKDERGYVTNSFGAVQIPDWAVRQKLDLLDEEATTERDLEAELKEHRKAVGAFLSELYQIMVDPLDEGTRTVNETMEALRAAALRDREKS